MNALANEKVGDYLNDHFVSSFLKVGTFTIANGQKQGGNVATYFCLPDGSVLHAIAGPVNAETFLREARWAVETRKMATFEANGSPQKYRDLLRKAHAERLQSEAGLNARQVQIYAPRIPGATLATSPLPQDAMNAYGRGKVHSTRDFAGHHHQGLGNQTQVHLIMANYPLVKVQEVYKYVFERILNERVSNLPVVQN
ncbi:MAG: hypothetical protein JNM56_28185 [Planctomycetia bacterium]|nr:hypothetical protein [Planctomycetia bacterium]